MTSANVSTMTMQRATSERKSVKTDSMQAAGDFMQVMHQNLQTKPENNSTDVTEKLEQKEQSFVQMDSKTKDVPVVEAGGTEEVAKETEQQVEAFAEKVKDLIAQELGIDVKDVEKAMELLGITAMDLTDKLQLSQLVAELTGCESKVDLLLQDSFTGIVSQVDDLTKALAQEIGVSLEDLATQTTEQPMASVEENVAKSWDVSKETSMMDMEDVKLQQTEDVAEVSEEFLSQKEAGNTAESVSKYEEQDIGDVDTVQPQQQKTQTQQEMSFSQDLNQRNQSSQQKSDGMNFDSVQQPVGLQTGNQYEPMTGNITLSTGEVVQVREMIDQIVEVARTTITSNNTTIEMLLNPEGLGKILMEVTQKEGKITAHIYTQDETVKQALEQHIVLFKEQMNHSQMKVDSIEVSVATHEFERNLEEGQQQQQQEQEQNHQTDRKMRNLNMNHLDELMGLMTEEEQLVTQMMREQGNSINFTA